MKLDTAQSAVAAALKGDWEGAININLDILSSEPDNVDALNRLAKAYFEQNNIAKAKATAKKVLEIDPFNTIATKCLQKWKSANGSQKNTVQIPKDAKIYLEEPGKTKITALLNLGKAKTIASLGTGDELKLNVAGHRVSVTTQETGNYVGRLTDDLSARLRKFVKMGNKYIVLVKSVEAKGVKVFIREIERVKGLADTPSFPTERIDYVSFTPPELVHKKDHVTLEEDVN